MGCVAPNSPKKAKAKSAIDRVPFGNFDDPPVLVPKKDPLQKKRDQYVLEQRKTAPVKPADSFDRAVAETLKAQVRR